ncbi:hypothetical protein Ocin01_01182 [Orchesella cincta]|uniref:Uncharacterized protein n=1 Tax=Orchesella cincta TaxID=48709 RepID=A0A1D2NJQ1_ORCCI|nr:hypothetical protein Ocin01_01182 [Orchesella cincta]
MQNNMEYLHKRDFVYESEEELQDEMDSDSVMKEIQRLYNAKEVGLREGLKYLKMSSLTTPRQKITVLLVGSHYAAKEKFLSLYFNESRQDEFISKVNYEKLDKIFITQGMRRRVLTGETVLDYCPHLAQLGNVPGLKDYLTTEITARKTKSLVSFVLAPENMDNMIDNNEVTFDENNNSLKYPFKIERAMKTLAQAADLIFIFFDPTGETHPSKTLKPFEDLWENYHEKIHLLLAKASDRECNEETRERTLTQVVQHVWRHPQVQRFGCVPKIFCPNLTDNIRDEEQLWNIIQQTADKSIERALHQLGDDATFIKDKLNETLDINNKAKDEGFTSSPVVTSAFIFLLLITTIWVTQISDIYCKTLLVPQSGRFERVCDEIKANKSLVFSFIITVTFFIFRPLFRYDTPILDENEVELINKRIQFAHHALYQKEMMQKLYTTSKSYDFD